MRKMFFIVSTLLLTFGFVSCGDVTTTTDTTTETVTEQQSVTNTNCVTNTVTDTIK